MKIITILGTRPEIIKLSPLLAQLEQEFQHKIIHTGQHYDHDMDQIFFEELKLPKPNYSLNIGSQTQGKQTASMLEKIEQILMTEKPNCILVQGDTNSTLSGALAASKLNIPIIHLEAGCRSFNKHMPEEINRILVDHMSTYLLAPDQKSVDHLLKENIKKENIFCVGSTSFDAILRNKEFINSTQILKEFQLQKEKYLLITLHRAENTNNLTTLKNIIDAINQVAEKIVIVFPLHPRTKKIIEENNISLNQNIKLIPPQSYLSFLALMQNSKFIISDSGGIQEESVALNKPCLITREETEWTRLTDAGKNILVGTQTEKIINTINQLLDETNLQKIKEIPCPIEAGASQKVIEIIKKIPSKSKD